MTATLEQRKQKAEAEAAALAAAIAEQNTARRDAEAKARRAVLEGVGDTIASLQGAADRAQAELDATAQADTLDLQALVLAFDGAAQARHALDGYRETARERLTDAGMDASIAAGIVAGTSVYREIARDEDGWPLTDENGGHVFTETAGETYFAAEPVASFAQYLDGVLAGRQRAGNARARADLNTQLNDAQTAAGKAFDK